MYWAARLRAILDWRNPLGESSAGRSVAAGWYARSKLAFTAGWSWRVALVSRSEAMRQVEIGVFA